MKARKKERKKESKESHDERTGQRQHTNTQDGSADSFVTPCSVIYVASSQTVQGTTSHSLNHFVTLNFIVMVCMGLFANGARRTTVPSTGRQMTHSHTLGSFSVAWASSPMTPNKQTNKQTKHTHTHTHTHTHSHTN